jgi:hypothetical protein
VPAIRGGNLRACRPRSGPRSAHRAGLSRRRDPQNRIGSNTKRLMTTIPRYPRRLRRQLCLSDHGAEHANEYIIKGDYIINSRHQ